MRRLLVCLGLLLPLLLAPAAPRAEEPPSVKSGVEDVQEKINEAIDRGVVRLLRQQMTDGSWGHESMRYPSGMTALAVYTLLKSGMPVDHPCVALGLENVLSVDPQETYVIACQLLALGATGNPTHHPRMAALAERLQSFAVRGSWSYPLAHEGSRFADRPGLLDLSNTQFAVLGLYAAHKVGIPVPRRLLADVIRATRFHQQIPKKHAEKHPDGTPKASAGFAYRGPGQTGLGPATGSMTCAGITVLELCRRMLGRKIGNKHAGQIEESIRNALTWLEGRWTVEGNPNAEQSHKLYYLYGLERVGSLLGIERIGVHPWYSEGARELLALQKEGGEWGTPAETAFALLFLLRATKGEVTGEARARSALPTYATDEESPLRIRAEGHSPMAVWVTSVHPDVRSRLGEGGHVAFTRIEYLVGDEVDVTVAQSAAPHGADPTHRAVLNFPRAGKYVVRARGVVAGKDGDVVLRSAPLEVDVRFLVQPWAWDEATWWARDLREIGQVEASASTEHADFQGPGKTVDRHTEGYWVCQSKPPDPRPTLQVQLRPGVKANAIVLSPVPRRDEDRLRFDRPTRFEVVVNGKGEALAVQPEEDELRSTVVRLPKAVRVKAVDVTIAERTRGNSWPGECGFREVTFELVAVEPPTHTVDGDGRCVLSCETPDAEIRFTLDGTVPTRESPRYEQPFAWPGATRLHARAWLPSGESSRLLTARLP